MTRWRGAKRPPRDGEDVLVFLPSLHTTLIGYYESDALPEWYVYDQGATTDVSHWQPLPAPPRVRKGRKR